MINSEPIRPATMLRDYQRKAIYHQLYNPSSMLWLGCSLGKTAITLTTIEHRIRTNQIRAALVFGPVRVIHSVWEKEARKWEHLQHLRFNVIHGTPDKRLKQLFDPHADVYLCNYENMSWLATELMKYYIDQDKVLPFQKCVYDEVTRVKKSTTKRVGGGWKIVQKEHMEMLPKAGEFSYEDYLGTGWTDDLLIEHEMCKLHPEIKIRMQGWREIIPHFQFKTGLTGSPAPNGYEDLHGQFLCVDNGDRLGTHITHYKEDYFTPNFNGWGVHVTDLGKQVIEQKISDITLQMATEDYLDLPEVIPNPIVVDLPTRVRKQYEEVEKEMFTVLDNGTEIELFNRASVSIKSLQFASGGVYHSPDTDEWSMVHDKKLEALDTIIEEAAGNPVALAYNFRFDAARIIKWYKKKKNFNVVDVSSVKNKDTTKMIEDWCAGKIHLLIGNPASMAHGLDGLQYNGNILVWFGLTWNYEDYYQLIRRFIRTGRVEPLYMHTILCDDTVDLAVQDALDHKADDEEGLKAALKRYRSLKQQEVM